MIAQRDCPFCGHLSEIKVDPQQYARWLHGEVTSKAFPDMSTNDQELITTGICDKCHTKEEKQNV